MDVRTGRASKSSTEGVARRTTKLRCSLRRLTISLIALVALVGALVGGTVLLGKGDQPAAPTAQVHRHNESDFQPKLCEEFPYIKFEVPDTILNNNLANKGPDVGRGEGIAYRALAVGGNDGSVVKEILLTINATSSDYQPFAPMLNGVSGRYGTINLNSGSEVDLTFTFYDRRTMQRLTMKNLAITWFDLDTGGAQISEEYLISHGHESYHLSEKSEVRVQRQHGGRTRFYGSVAGVGENNPKDPFFLTEQQFNRAVTVLYGDTDSLQITIGATAGSGPRFFNFFHGRPSILCATTVQPDFRPLPDLSFSPPMESCVMAGQGETFVSFSVHKGQKVTKGTVIATTRKGEKRQHHRAAFDGVVTQLQALKPGEKLDARLGERILAIVRKPFFRTLPLSKGSGVEAGGPGEEAGLSYHARFVRYLVEVGDRIFSGKSIAVVHDNDGTRVQVKATGYGIVHARQEDLKEGQLLLAVPDLNLITLAPFPALGPLDHDSVAAAKVPARAGLFFSGYRVRTGDSVKAGDGVATVKHWDGTEDLITSTHPGFVTSLQHLEEGTPIDRVEDRNLCTVGRFNSLPIEPGMAPVGLARDPRGLSFLAYHVRPGDVVETGDLVAEVQYPLQVALEIRAPRPGIVKHIYKDLRPGMPLEGALRDTKLATLGRLPALRVAEGEEVAFAPSAGSWELLQWRVQEDNHVLQGYPIAVLEDRRTRARTEVRANRSGFVVQIQKHLQPGDVVESATEANDLAVIGLLRGPPIGTGEKGVDVPDLECTFAEWKVRVGDKVLPGDIIAVVKAPPSHSQLNTAGANSGEGRARSLLTQSQSLPVSTSVGGWVNYRAFLTPGQKISEQTLSRTIAKVQQGCPWWGLPPMPECRGNHGLDKPWWLWLLLLLVTLCTIFLCLLCLVKPQRAHSYKPMTLPLTSMGDEQPTPRLEPEAESDCVRLDFEQAGARRTVYARYRPLGLQHRHVAPVVVEGFSCNSYARQELGVQPGWKLVRVGDCELKDSTDFEHVAWQLDIRMRELPVWPLLLEFRRQPDDARVNAHACSFLERPLGLQLGDTAPVRVLKVHGDGPAERQSVQVGWFLTKVGDFEVQSGHTFSEVMRRLGESLEGLPERGRPQGK